VSAVAQSVAPTGSYCGAGGGNRTHTSLEALGILSSSPRPASCFRSSRIVLYSHNSNALAELGPGDAGRSGRWRDIERAQNGHRAVAKASEASVRKTRPVQHRGAKCPPDGAVT
jgi:hypothetical protein